MSALLQSIADAVATGLASKNWAIAGTTVGRANWISKGPEQLVAPAIVVTAGNRETVRIARPSQRQNDYTVQVYVAQKVDTDAEVTAISDQAEAVLDALMDHSFAGVTFPAGTVSPLTVTIETNPDDALNERVVRTLKQAGVEFRRGTSGGGNQLRQPYLRQLLGEREYAQYPEVDHVHFYGYYLGNYPELDAAKIPELCAHLNQL